MSDKQIIFHHKYAQEIKKFVEPLYKHITILDDTLNELIRKYEIRKLTETIKQKVVRDLSKKFEKTIDEIENEKVFKGLHSSILDRTIEDNAEEITSIKKRLDAIEKR